MAGLLHYFVTPVFDSYFVIDWRGGGYAASFGVLYWYCVVTLLTSHLIVFDFDDLSAGLALRVKGSLYPFRWVARWHPSAPI